MHCPTSVHSGEAELQRDPLLPKTLAWINGDLAQEAEAENFRRAVD